MITLYDRPVGVICYEASIFGYSTEERAHLPARLRGSALRWYWESLSSHAREVGSGHHEGSARGPLPHRRLTILDVDGEACLTSDLLERDDDQYGRFIALFGVEGPDVTSYLTEDSLAEALQAFVDEQSSDIALVVVQIGDSPWEHVFVPHQPTRGASTLLREWGIVPERITNRRPYSELRLAALEAVYHLAGRR